LVRDKVIRQEPTALGAFLVDSGAAQMRCSASVEQPD
jgi:hypothetical protein